MANYPMVARNDHGEHHREDHPHAPEIPTGEPRPPRHAQPSGGCLNMLRDLAETWLVGAALLAAAVALLVLGLTLDAAAAGGLAAVAGGGLFSGYFRRNRPDVDELDQAAGDAWSAIGIDVGARPLPERTDVIPVVRRRKERAPQDLRRAYGRASDTIHRLRGEAALLRQHLAVERRLAETAELEAAEADRAADVLRDALEALPEPDPRQLGERLKDVWLSSRPPHVTPEARWRDVAVAAIESVRGLWPIPARAEVEQNAPADGLAGWEVATLEALADQRLAAGSTWPWFETPKTSPGGGEGSGPEAPAPGDTVEGIADAIRDELAQVLATRELELTGSKWGAMHEDLRTYFRDRADDVILAGWRPPLRTAATVDQRPVIAALLTDHEQLANGACRCGWGRVCDIGSGEHPMWHDEHVAEQLLATGALRPTTATTGARL